MSTKRCNENSVTDGRTDAGQKQVISKCLQYNAGNTKSIVNILPIFLETSTPEVPAILRRQHKKYFQHIADF